MEETKGILLKQGTFMDRKTNILFVAALLSWMVNMVSGMADSVVAGKLLDVDAVSAVGIVTPVFTLTFCLVCLVTYGVAYKYGNLLGNMEKEKSERIAGMGLLVGVVTGIVIAVLMFVCEDLFFTVYECSEAVASRARIYYRGLIPVCAFQSLFYAVYNLIAIDGDETTVLAANLVACVGNVLFSVICTGIMGVGGLAAGTLISFVLAFFILLLHFRSRKNSIRFRIWFNVKDCLECLNLASSEAMTYLYTALLDMIMNKVILVLMGEIYLPAYTVVNSVINMAAVFMCAVNAGSCFITIYYGERNFRGVRRAMKKVIKLTAITALCFTAFMILIAPYWPDLYGITDPKAVEASVFAGTVIPLTYVILGLVYSLFGYYPLVDKSLEGNVLSFCTSLLGPLLLALPLAYLSGFNGMCVGFVLAPVLIVILLYLYFVITRKIKIAPLLLGESGEWEDSFDLTLTPENIIKVRDEAKKSMEAKGLPVKVINKVSMIVEDTLVYIMKKNQKKVIAECCILMDKEHVRLFIRDSGEIFDLTKEADDSLDLSCYVMARVMSTTSLKNNSVTGSFNRNAFIWELEQPKAKERET